MNKTCTLKGCVRKYAAKGFCFLHYDRNLRTGNPGPAGLIRRNRVGDIPEEVWFWANVEKTKTCWHWQRSKNNTGYGTLFWKGQTHCAHRVSHYLYYGALPKNRELDHLCKNRACVNPKHLEVVTHRENVLRGLSPSAVHAKKTHCPKGHPYSGTNLAFSKRKNGRKQRRCRACG